MAEKVSIVVDTREQEPYSFPPERFLIERRALPAGDYSLAGFEHDVAIERKTAEDFVHTVIRERDRFRSELLKLQTYMCSCIVVEANFEELLSGNYRSGAHPASVTGAAISIIVDYGVPVFFCSNRQCACRFVQEYLLRCHRRFADTCQMQQESTFESGEKSSGSSIHPLTSLPDAS